MPSYKKHARKRRSTIRWSVILIPAGVVAILTLAAFSFAAHQEEQDSFCASCHTQPETTYFAREQAGGNPPDLAVFHTTKGTKCIDCHSGDGTTGRVNAIMMGAHNALAWYTKTATQPAPLTIAIGDGNCVKCHSEVYNSGGFNNHFHEFLPRWQLADPNAAGCVDCHTSHATNGDPTIAFLNQAQTEQVCQRCHNTLGGG